MFFGVFGAGLSIPLLFSSREGLVHKEKNPKNSRARPKMPPKRTVLPMLSWAKKGGQLTTHARGIIFGMHTTGMFGFCGRQAVCATPTPRPSSTVEGMRPSRVHQRRPPPRRKRSPSVGAESMRFCGSAAGMATLTSAARGTCSAHCWKRG